MKTETTTHKNSTVRMSDSPQILLTEWRCSGLYLVSLRNEKLISVNADRPKISQHCISVNKNHCKFGKAKDLARRQRDYYKNFGAENVIFQSFIVTDHIDQAEHAIRSKLKGYQMRGQTGRLNEWMVGVDTATVREIVVHTMNGSNIPFKLVVDSNRSSKM